MKRRRQWYIQSQKSKTLIQRFLEKIQFCNHGMYCQDCCWLWTAAKGHHGHGVFFLWYDEQHRKIQMSAPVFMFIQMHGELEPGQEVCHTCDVGACVNWLHLWPGTHQENMQDMVSKERHWNKIDFTKDDIQLIWQLRYEGKAHWEIAHMLNVSPTYIYGIIHYRYQIHLTRDMPDIRKLIYVHTPQQGEKHSQAKFTDDDIRTMYILRQQGWTYQSIADKYKASIQYIWQIIHGERRITIYKEFYHANDTA